MKIKILKPTIAVGKNRKVNEELEVSDKEGKALVAMRKAENLDKTVNMELTVELTPEFEAKLKEVSQQAEEVSNENSELKEELSAIKQDIMTLTLKELREKYKVEETTEE